MTRFKVSVPSKADGEAAIAQQCSEDMRVKVDMVREDIKDIGSFYNVNFSTARINRMTEYLKDRHAELDDISFEGLDGLQAQTDFVLLRNYLERQLQGFKDFETQHKKLEPIIEPFANSLVELIERRQTLTPTDGQYAADVLSLASKEIRHKSSKVSNGSLRLHGALDRVAAFGAVNVLRELNSHLKEYYGFYKGYDPTFTWWISAPYEQISKQFTEYSELVLEKLVGVAPGDEDAIIGQPVGREGLVSALESAVIAYSPEELIQLAEREYSWCESEMIEASKAMGHGKDWRAALEEVKSMYVPPGAQTELVRELGQEAIDYVKEHDMVTIPRVAEENWRTFMMSPERQKVNPFFLGGSVIIVSYPTDTMSHEDKMMSMRGNSRPFSRSTVFHELIPGHHLQDHFMSRYKTHRQLFTTCFWTEGWAFYWEMLFYNRSSFVSKPEDKIGMLFWRMHRCIRIVFSLSFHMGKLTPQECVDMLVKRVGHERATAEGEVRRSFNGDYPPLYQAGYMLGALQFYKLRTEMVEHGNWTEKQFHDRVLRENNMPIEILRALLQGRTLKPDYRAEWRFYDL